MAEDLRCVFEFSMPLGCMGEVYRLLERHNISLWVAELEKLEVPEAVTADFCPPPAAKAPNTSRGYRVRRRAGGGVARAREGSYPMFKHEEAPNGELRAEGVFGRWSG
jgi:hypothetical protein